MKQRQVRVMGANVASEQPEKTAILVDLVPLEEKFDNSTAFLTFEKFWHKRVAIKTPLFGDYEVLYVLYPGLECLHHLLVVDFIFFQYTVECSLNFGACLLYDKLII